MRKSPSTCKVTVQGLGELSLRGQAKVRGAECAHPIGASLSPDWPELLRTRPSGAVDVPSAACVGTAPGTFEQGVMASSKSTTTRGQLLRQSDCFETFTRTRSAVSRPIPKQG